MLSEQTLNPWSFFKAEKAASRISFELKYDVLRGFLYLVRAVLLLDGCACVYVDMCVDKTSVGRLARMLLHGVGN